MAGVGEGASVLAFVLLGLQSAKIIYEVVSSIKDGNETVHRATRDVLNLQSTLERLKKCRIITEHPDEALEVRTKACAEDMASFAEKLKKLAVADPHGLERHWKKIKVFLSEKDLVRMSAAVVGHTAGLNFHLNILESDAIFEVKDGLGAIQQGQQTITQSQSRIISQQTTLTETMRDTMTQVTATTRSAHDETQSLHQSIRAAFDSSAAQQEQMLQQLDQLKSLDQLEKLTQLEKLDQLVEKLSALQARLDSGSGVVEEVDDDGQPVQEDAGLPDDEVLPNDALFHCVNSVLEAIRDKEGVFGLEEAEEEAEEIAEALVSLLQTVASDLSRPQPPANPHSPQRSPSEAYPDSDMKQLRRNLRTLQGIVMSARSISVNETSGQKRIAGTIIESRYAKRTHDHTSGTMTVATVQRSWRHAHFPASPVFQASAEHTEVLREEKMEITFFPKHRKRNSKCHGFQAVMHQYHDHSGTYNTIPRLWVNNILPSNSPVFAAVHQGRLGDFREMLMSGKASLRDHDEFGASLLFYAMLQPDVCRFLLQHGADVDHVARIPLISTNKDIVRCIDSLFVGTALNISLFSEEEYSGGPEEGAGCTRLLLEHGCDPAAPLWDYDELYQSSYLWSVLENGDLGKMRIVLDHSPSLIIASSLDGSSMEDSLDGSVALGMTPLLVYCDHCNNLKAEAITFLLDRGADVHDRDTRGRTCLHLLTRRGLDYFGSLEDALSAFESLIRRGADVRAVDSDGCGVHEVVYRSCWSRGTSDWGDLWDAILADFDFDVADCRQRFGRPRVAGYGSSGWGKREKKYTRHTFEKLWKGKEHLCPYYYDEEKANYVAEEASYVAEKAWDGASTGYVTTSLDEETESSDEEDNGGCVLGED